MPDGQIMVLGVGVDLVQTERVARALVANGARFEERVFTANELAECAHRRDRIEALAARFAAKEACFKALGAGLLERASLNQVEVTRSNGGPPELRFTGAIADRARSRGVRSAHVSLTHDSGVAAAVVVLEGPEPGGA